MQYIYEYIDEFVFHTENIPVPYILIGFQYTSDPSAMNLTRLVNIIDLKINFCFYIHVKIEKIHIFIDHICES